MGITYYLLLITHYSLHPTPSDFSTSRQKSGIVLTQSLLTIINQRYSKRVCKSLLRGDLAQRANHRCEYCQAPKRSFRFDAGLGIGLSTIIENCPMGNGKYGKIRLLQDVNTDLGDRSAVLTISM
ncbi:MAG: hypothetical protein V7K39_10120 [Nostoc sp.]